MKYPVSFRLHGDGDRAEFEALAEIIREFNLVKIEEARPLLEELAAGASIRIEWLATDVPPHLGLDGWFGGGAGGPV